MKYLLGKTNFKSLLIGGLEIGEGSDTREECIRKEKKY